MMWVRDEAKPARYNDVEFRSGLEAKVAEQLDELGVVWRYEVEPHVAVSWFTGSYEPDPPRIVGYLPDFAIVEAPDDLHLPLWVEVKPPGLLYAVRDHLGVPERFTDDHIKSIDAKAIRDAGIEEIWKPKALAERYGRDVLVVSEVNRNRTLSILMRPGEVVLSRRHPAVNYRQVIRDREKAEQEARWRAKFEAEAAERARLQAEQVAQWVSYVRQQGRPARFDGWCVVCRAERPAPEILIARDDSGGWRATCRSHLDQSAA